MKKRRLGNSDLMVSEICMGCMGFGDPTRGQHTWTLDEKSSREIIIQGLEAGINFFDTAIAYQSGTSEKYLGKQFEKFLIEMMLSSQPSFCLKTMKKLKKESMVFNMWKIC